ncbi:GNAT family N-acetyltransferase [Stenotrophomonas sp. NPDC077659]|uniref:GNAT family N-acetyltransferase n=1 Tax=Stenotrophomonas sp. NPDC077659 TaxID=3390694 RepID=UPI003CFD4E1E
MTEFSTTVVQYWDSLLHRGRQLPSTPGLTAFVNPGLDVQRRAMILEAGDGSVHAALTPGVAAAAKLTAHPATPFSPATLREALRSGGIRLHAPDLVYYASPGAVAKVMLKPSVRVRQLGPEDAKTFELFTHQAFRQDQEDAYVELDHWSVFGAFDEGELLAAASMYPWGGAAIADMGVLTLPRARGAGLGRALVGALRTDAEDRGHHLQYRCQHDNHASIALARSSGLVRYGTWEVAYES